MINYFLKIPKLVCIIFKQSTLDFVIKLEIKDYSWFFYKRRKTSLKGSRENPFHRE